MGLFSIFLVVIVHKTVAGCNRGNNTNIIFLYQFLDGHTNITAFDFFDLLAEKDQGPEDANLLRAAYHEGPDAHPNRTATLEIVSIFVDFVIKSIQQYKITHNML